MFPVSPRRLGPTALALGLTAGMGVVAMSCGGGDDDGVTVFAAASLTEAFAEIGEVFDASTGVQVTLNHAGSSDLATQVIEGAPADVFASADPESMQRVVDAGATSGSAPAIFATNELVLVVEPGNPLGVDGIAALARPDPVVVLCAPEVPCGRYAEESAGLAGVEPDVDSYEANVKAVVTKVSVGEADIGVAYRTDAIAADGRVTAVEIPPDENVVAEYPIAVLAESAGPEAEDFVAFVLGPDGRRILARHGFGQP
jgi:molybdate transport system substrate-binding protein